MRESTKIQRHTNYYAAVLRGISTPAAGGNLLGTADKDLLPQLSDAKAYFGRPSAASAGATQKSVSLWKYSGDAALPGGRCVARRLIENVIRRQGKRGDSFVCSLPSLLAMIILSLYILETGDM